MRVFKRRWGRVAAVLALVIGGLAPVLLMASPAFAGGPQNPDTLDINAVKYLTRGSGPEDTQFPVTLWKCVFPEELVSTEVPNLDEECTQNGGTWTEVSTQDFSSGNPVSWIGPDEDIMYKLQETVPAGWDLVDVWCETSDEDIIWQEFLDQNAVVFGDEDAFFGDDETDPQDEISCLFVNDGLPGIGLDKTTDDHTPATNQLVDYSYTVTNTGNEDLYLVYFTDPLPAGLDFQSFGATGDFSCDEDPDDSNVIKCWLGNGSPPWADDTLAVGESITIHVTVKVTAASGDITNTATVEGFETWHCKIDAAGPDEVGAENGREESCDPVTAQDSDTVKVNGDLVAGGGATLPRTGSSTLPLTGTGIGLLGLGLAASLLARRRRGMVEVTD